MSAADLAAILVSVVALSVTAALVHVIVRLRHTTEQLTRSLEEVRSTLEGSVESVAGMVDDLDHDLRRVGGLVDKAEQVSARAETLLWVTYGAVARPVIKTAAVMKGTGRAARMLRRGGGGLDERAG